MGAEDLVTNGHDVVVIEYHISDVFETPYAVARQMYYYVTALPTVYFDGVIEYTGGNNTTSMYATYLPFYEERKSLMSDFFIDIEGTNSQLIDYVVNITVEKVAPNNGQNLRLMLALTESEIPYVWMGQPLVNYCERLMLPDHNGTLLDFSNGDILDFSFNFSLEPEWVQEHCELAVWIQNLSSKEVQQAAKRSLSEFGGFPERDATINWIYAPATMCNNSFEPGIDVVNLGSDDLTSIDILYQADNGAAQTYNWTGNIPYGESEVIAVPDVDLTVANSSIFNVYLENPNGEVDEFIYNDTLSTIIEKAEDVSSPVTLVLKLDDYPEQTSWEVLNSEGTVLYSGGEYSDPGVFVTEPFNLSETDCYSFKIYDSNGDGLAGTGLYKLMYGTTVFHQGKAFGLADEVQFGIGLTNVTEQNLNNIAVYPNPVSGLLNIKIESATEIELLDMKGQVVLNQSITKGTTQIDLSDQVSGVYLLRFKGDRDIEIRKVVVQN